MKSININLNKIIIAILLIFYFIVTYHIACAGEFHRKRLFFSIIMLALPVFLFCINRFLAVILVPFFSFLLCFNAYISYKFIYISENMLLAISGTNIHEARSIFSAVNPAVPGSVLVAIMVIAYVAWRYARFRPAYALTSGLLMTVMVVHAGYKFYIFPAGHYFQSNRLAVLGMHMPGFIGNSLYVIGMFFDPENRIESVAHTQIDSMILGKKEQKEKNIIIVIGESDVSDRHNIYGYKKWITTPNMNELQHFGKLCAIANSHSSANVTRNAVPMIMSFYEPDQQEKLYSEKNLIELAKDNGYKTYWISSQDGRGAYSRPFGYLSEFSNYVTRQDYNNSTNHVNWHDESLLPIIKEKFSEISGKKFVVIHIMGSHTSYDDKRSFEDMQALPKADAYDQSIHRTDRILKQILTMADADLHDYTLFYTSDHGEVVNAKPAGHGLQYGGYAQYRTPAFLINASVNSKTNYCKMAEDLRNNDGYYTEVMDKFLLLNMMGYQVSPAAIQTVREHDRILHSDGKVYDYKDLPHDGREAP